ncbi:gem-associated protein 2-like isoform X2 [Athalia rosae]|uniref:gem-associated protein 2-like isoform X2 n=1 Tax=Athalia rosae TaxID=37344 RepID=UPI0006261D24|nr:gem-associated protein 2-like isoform X2 [Athalia rosae]
MSDDWTPGAVLLQKMTDCLREPALFVGEIHDEFDLLVPPASGEEYIKRVVLEAQQCDDVVVAEISNTRLKPPVAAVHPLAGCVEAPSTVTPSLDWQQCQLADFSSLRLDIAQIKNEILNSKQLRQSLNAHLPGTEDQEGWLHYCLNNQRPLLSLILSMNQPLVEQGIELLIETIEEKGSIGQEHGEWTYSLLAALELPLNPETCSSLRSLARACSVIRAKTAEDNAQEIAATNLFICLVARYFRQMDLADP